MRWLVFILFGLACGSTGSSSVDAGGSFDGRVSDSGAADADRSDGRDEDSSVPVDRGLLAIDDLEYVGAFRFASSTFGESSVNYAVGTLGYNPDRRSLFIAGHAQHNAVAEFAIPDRYGTADVVEELPLVGEPLQEFQRLLDRPSTGNPDGMDRYTGLYWHEGHLIVQANRWYDASGRARDTTLLVVDGDLSGSIRGYFQLTGAAHSAGYISAIPPAWQDALGGSTLAGWASNYSIVSRYSVGPSLFVFEPDAVTDQASNPAAGGAIEATPWMNFGYADGQFLADDALEYACDREDEVTTCESGASASALWNIISRGMYGFIVPGTRTYAVFGSSGGVETGLGYKIDQDDGRLCGGPCARGASDYYNYYWFFDIDEILAADEVHTPRPYAYGPWSLPFDDGGAHRILGGAWNADEEVLYLSLANAAQVGDFDRPPLLLAFRLAE
ncbi:MAG: hypothetical protein AAGE52_25475 [Myxococcota bacterium]